MAKIEVPLDAGDFSLLDARVVEVLRSIPETNRSLRGLRSWVGFRDVGVEYEREGRFAGRSKYGLADYWSPMRIGSGCDRDSTARSANRRLLVRRRTSS